MFPSPNNPFLSLKHMNYRIYWISMFISLVGMWMQSTAQPWLAYSITNSPLMLSLIGVAQFTPQLVFSLFAGAFIDRWSKKRLLILTQSLSVIITLTLALLVHSGRIEFYHIIITSLLMGVVNTFDMPARQSFIIDLVDKDSLMNAIALNSMSFNVARMIGPAIAGLLMASAGIEFCFFANSISFAGVILALLMIKPFHDGDGEKSKDGVLADVVHGLKYIRETPVLLFAVAVMAIVGTFAPNFNVLLPAFARDMLHLNETGYGLLLSFMGLGSFLGAISLASLSGNGPKRWVLARLPFAVGAMLVMLGMSSSFMMAGVFLALCGFLFVIFTSTANSTLQLSSSDNYRGRVMSVFTLVFAGSTPIGNLFAGSLASLFSPQVGLIGCGLAIIALMAAVLISGVAEKPQDEDMEDM